MKMPMSAMLGSARPTFETLEGEEEAPVPVAEPEAERHGDAGSRLPSAVKASSSVSTALWSSSAGVVGDEPERVDEEPEAERVSGIRAPWREERAARSASSASAVRASTIASAAGRQELGPEDVRLRARRRSAPPSP